jgi:alkanesulfonate monooxygenase SsuD/methylene tetrahydromethanopterin reductase-like flavin-dependent oxidoreductase (luciferase family)
MKQGETGMHVGMTAIFQNPEGNLGSPDLDASVYDTEYEMADRAEALGFDSLWGVEHHFNGYAMCPDPLKFLTYFAGRTKHIKLGTMVVVAPWHDPIRVAEDSSVLDHISGGRNILGIGRGVAKIEFDGFKLDMNQSRQLLIENTEAVQMGLEKGYIQYDGEIIHQPYVQIRPKPTRSFQRRIYASAASPESYPIFGRLGVGLLFIPGGKPWEMVAADLGQYRKAFRETHHREPLAPIFAGWTFVDEDAGRAEELGRKYIDGYIKSALNHYNTSGGHLEGVKGYESYVANAKAAAAAGVTEDKMASVFVDNHIYGTPDQCFEKIKKVREQLGAAGFLGIFNYAGMDAAEAKRNQELFAAKVLPRLKALEPHLDVGSDAAPEVREPAMAAE